MTSISGTRVFVKMPIYLTPTPLGAVLSMECLRFLPGLAVLLAVGQLSHGTALASAVLTVRPAQGQDGVHRGVIGQAEEGHDLRLATLPARGQHGPKAGGVDAE